MRIWSIHPKYLDTKGLVAVWREGLLAKRVLEGKTKGYNHHPQLIRFRQTPYPLAAINQYLYEIYREATSRNYRFDQNKIDKSFEPVKMTVTRGQMEYEMAHLLKKLAVRDKNRFEQWRRIRKIEPVKLFSVIRGDIEDWEVRAIEK